MFADNIFPLSNLFLENFWQG